MAVTMPWGEQIVVGMSLGFPVNVFTLDSATDGIDQNSGGYDVAQHECVGASGVFDSEGNLIGAFIEYLYTRGSIQGIAT